MSFYINNKKIVNVYGGIDPLKAIYIGEQEVWRRNTTRFVPITPVDTAAFPMEIRKSVQRILNAESGWEAEDGGVWTSACVEDLANFSTSAVTEAMGEHFTFDPDASSMEDLQSGFFMFEGDSSLTGRIGFKAAETATLETWLPFITNRPESILIRSVTPDDYVWIPAIDTATNLTGYWNGENGFQIVHGGIEYVS